MDEPRYVDEYNLLPFKLEKEVLYKDEDAEVIAEVGEMVFIHFSYEGMTKGKYKKYLEVWEKVQEDLKERGHEIVFCIIPSHLPLADKAERMFGWELVQEAPPVTLFMKELEN